MPNLTIFVSKIYNMSQHIERILFPILEDKLFKGKALILMGARQVGKSTLMHRLISNRTERILNLNGDDPEVRSILGNATLSSLRRIVADYKVVFVDEAQRIENIGISLKQIADNMPDVQLLVSGSSSLDLRSKINEPLTGRKFEYILYPVSAEEIYGQFGLVETRSTLEERMIYGSYPEIVTHPAEAEELLVNLTESYLYKDLLAYEGVRKPGLINKLLVALALQVGSEVSYNELGKTVGSDSKTVEKYIDLLEKCYVVFRLDAYSRNLRNELRKSKKIYFYDTGVRNAVIGNFTRLDGRSDAGALWENYFISERIKFNKYHSHRVRQYFWRTSAQQEVDYIEEDSEGGLHAFEMKWNPKKGSISLPSTFVDTYHPKTVEVITPENYLDWLLPE